MIVARRKEHVQDERTDDNKGLYNQMRTKWQHKQKNRDAEQEHKYRKKVGTEKGVTRGLCIKPLSLFLSALSNLGVIEESAPFFFVRGVCALPCLASLIETQQKMKQLSIGKSTLRIPLWVLRLVLFKRGVWQNSLLGRLGNSDCGWLLSVLIRYTSSWGATGG
eukprot:3115104-Amphidinium_carterae.1